MDCLGRVRTFRVKAETSDGPAVSPSSNLVGGKTNERSEPGISSPAATNNHREKSAPSHALNTVRHWPIWYRRACVRAGDRQGSAGRDRHRGRVRLLGVAAIRFQLHSAAANERRRRAGDVGTAEGYGNLFRTDAGLSQ